MTRRLLAALALALLLSGAQARAESSASAAPTPSPAESPAPVPTASPSPSFEPAVIVSDNGKYVNLREGPSTDTRSIAQYAPGTKVACVFVEGETWLSVRANGVTGYMIADYLTPAPEETAPPLSLGLSAHEEAGYTLSASLSEARDILTAHVEVTYDSETAARLTGLTLLLDGREAAALLPYYASDDPNKAAFHVAFYYDGEVSEASLLTPDGTEIPLSPQ